MNTNQLLAEANKRIEVSGLVVSGRTERFINLRTFRMYRAQGLVDKPQETKGVNGIYGEKHLLQLLAIKVLQSKWMPIKEIKMRTANTNIEGLNKIIAGEIPPCPSNKKQASPGHHWIEVRLSEYAYAMIEYNYIKSLNKSSTRAFADRLATLLADKVDSLKGLDYGKEHDIQKNGTVDGRLS